jgi:hypothetical protein
MIDEVHSVSWALAGVSHQAIVGRHSRRHWFVGHAGRTLCGTLIPWARVHGSFEADCESCKRAAERRGLDLEDVWHGQTR